MDRVEKKRKLNSLRALLGDISESTAYAVLNGRYGLGYGRATLAARELGGSFVLWYEDGNKLAKRKLYSEAKI